METTHKHFIFILAFIISVCEGELVPTANDAYYWTLQATAPMIIALPGVCSNFI